MKTDSVDDFVKARVLPELRPVVSMLRRLMKQEAPRAAESISYGIPAYRLQRIVAVISPTKRDITLSFSRGAQMKDKYQLLRGVGKSSRHVKLKSAAAANVEALRYYIRQAVELDKK
jgi:hypothetical protein